MRLLHVIDRLAEGGAETSLREELLATGCDFEHGVAVLYPDGNRVDELSAAGIPVFQPARTCPSRLSRTSHVLRTIRSYQPDLVHTSLFEADFAGRVAAKVTGTPAVTSLVNTPYAPEVVADPAVSRRKLAAVRAVDRVLSRHATVAFRAISQAVADAAVRDLGVPRERIRVVPRSRDLRRLGACSSERRARVRRQLGVGEAAPVLLNVARQEAQKGLAPLVEAVARLRDEDPGVVLLQAGRAGNRTRQLHDQVARHGLEENVRFLGFRDDVGDLLCAADVFVLPSRYEGLGGAALEAMAMRVPVVASDVPALREALDDGRCGVLAQPGDPAALATAVGRLLAEPAAAAGLARAGAERFATAYGRGAVMEHVRDFYRDAGRPEQAP